MFNKKVFFNFELLLKRPISKQKKTFFIVTVDKERN
jgi:hypothetical protein